MYTSMALYPGGKSLALDSTGDLVLLGGGDGSAGIHSISQNRLVHALEGAHGQITDTLWWGKRAILSTASGEVLIFEDGSEAARFESHAGSVTALALHPSGEILASVGVDKSYVLYDLPAEKPISQIHGNTGEIPEVLSKKDRVVAYLGCRFHHSWLSSGRASICCRNLKRTDSDLRCQVWVNCSDIRLDRPYQVHFLFGEWYVASYGE